MTSKFFTLFIALYISSHSALGQTIVENRTWDREQFQKYFGDFNGDGHKDVFLHSKRIGNLNPILVGIESGNTSELIANAYLDYSEEGFSSYEYSRIVVGDFDGDGADDLLNLVPSSNQAKVIFGGKDVFQKNVLEPVAISDEVNFDLNDDIPLYSGDFNGDGLDDILVVSPNYEAFVIYLVSQNESFTLTRREVIGLDSEYSKTLFINDYNGDGFEDVVAFPAEPNLPHLILITDDEGKLNGYDLKEFEVPPENLDWSTNNHTLLELLNADDGNMDVIRLKNSVGGIDKDGNILDENEEVTTQTLEELNANKCLQIAFSPESETTELTCAPWNREIERKTEGVSADPSVIGDEGEPPFTPLFAPIVSGGSYYAINSPYTVTGLSVGGGEDYYMYESTDNSNYTSVGGKSVTRTQSSGGYRYYKYKACNVNGCSGFSPYREIYIYTAPAPVGSFFATPNSINSGQSSELSWTAADGVISSGSYVLQVKNPGSNSYISLGIELQSAGSPFSFTVNPNSGAGTYSYRVRACNPNNLCGNWSTTFLERVNLPPTISGSPLTDVYESSEYSFTPTATDADGDSLYFGISGKPSWASFDSSTGQLSGTPSFSQAGTYNNIIISVNDGELSAQLPTYSITVINSNRAPTIIGVPSTEVYENSEYSFTPAATDEDGDSLYFGISGKPSWASFNSSTGQLSGTPSFSQEGTYNNIIISVNDGEISAQLPTYSITVKNSNRAPTIIGVPPTEVYENNVYSFTPTADDLDDDSLSFSISGKPNWASFNPSNGKLSGIPTHSQAGTYSSIKISVNDGEISAQLPTFSITVRIIPVDNTAPTISGSPTTEVDVDSMYSFAPTANDQDGDSLSFSISGKPSWASFNNGTGKLSGTPTELNVGVFSNIMIGVSDGSLSSQLPTFTITVNAISTTPPEVSPISPMSDDSYSVSDMITSSASAIDLDGSIASVQFRLDGGVWQIDSSEPYSHNFGSLSVGPHTIEFRAEDNGSNYSDIAIRNITITSANQRRVVFVHTDLLGSPATETNKQGNVQ